VTFLAKQIFGIRSSQIEIEKMFNLAKVLMSLQQHRLQMENLDKIITIVKNWFDYPHANCMENENIKKYLKA
jgi:hypothetical protein